MRLLELARWREEVARLYLSDLDLAGFRQARDQLFASHQQSPVPAADRASFARLAYFPPNPAMVVQAELEPARGRIQIDTGDTDGVVDYQRVAIAHTPLGPLTLWWIEAYGGGLFLPFRDGTCGQESYGGGRYLTDTVKGTFGRGLQLLDDRTVRLDFNYAYNPSCAYSPEWACPLAPPENRVTARIDAGEQGYAKG
jgi:uncharacterized protein (DUF1684 family)